MLQCAMQADDQAAVIVKHDGPLTRLVLNRPDRGNALGPEVVAALDAGLSEAVRAGSRLLVLQGAGRHFCTGFDLSGLDTLPDAALLERFVHVELLLQRVHAAPLTTLAVAAGRTTGAGADLFVACDRRLALPSARFVFPGSAFGLVLGTARLTRRVGVDAARTLLLDGAELGAEAAVAARLATVAVNEETVGEAVAAAVRAATRLDPETVTMLQRATAAPQPAEEDTALAAVVRSAARPGLRDRILRYRDGLRRP